MACKLNPCNLVFDAPHWPPSPRCFEQSQLLARWKHHQEVLDEIGRDPDRKDEYQTICGLGQSWLIERDGQNVVLSPDSSERDTRAWVFWDPVGGPLGTLIGVDRYGKVASNEFDLAELRPRRKDS